MKISCLHAARIFFTINMKLSSTPMGSRRQGVDTFSQTHPLITLLPLLGFLGSIAGLLFHNFSPHTPSSPFFLCCRYPPPPSPLRYRKGGGGRGYWQQRKKGEEGVCVEKLWKSKPAIDPSNLCTGREMRGCIWEKVSPPCPLDPIGVEDYQYIYGGGHLWGLDTIGVEDYQSIYLRRHL